ncbi:DUF1990 family protein [Streptomyces sp. NPDC002004]
MDGFTYEAVGVTAETDGPAGAPPARVPGFRSLRVSRRLGTGRAVYAAAAEALMTWRMHRAFPFAVQADAPSAAPGVRVTLRIGPVRAPCRVVWARRDEHRTGFAYGTLSGHPECGEEAFLVEQLPDDSVWFTVWAVSRPAAWYARAAGPLARGLQRAAAHRYASTVERLARIRRPSD